MPGVKKAFLCTYHHQDDWKKIEHYLSEYGFRYSYNRGYMIFYQFNQPVWPVYPYIRRGVVYGEHPAVSE